MGAVLGLLGYGCKEEQVRTMYGVPSGDLTFESQVTNEANDPLEGIQVIRYGGWKDSAGTMFWEEWADTLYTNADGKVHKEYTGDIPVTLHKVIVNDTSGKYQSDSVIAEVTYKDGEGAWYSGKATLKTDFVLKNKE